MTLRNNNKMFADRQSFKIFLTTFCFLAATFYCAGQSDTTHKNKFYYGINIGTSVSPATKGFNYFMDLTADKGKSFFAAGPIIGPKIVITRYIESKPVGGQYRLNGFHALYQFNPNPKGKRFDFFFQYEFIYLLYQDQGQMQTWNYANPYQPTLIDYKSHDQYFEHYIGYGFKVKFLKHFNLTQSFGLGLLFYSSIVNDQMVDGIPHNISGNVKMTIGYTADRK